MREIISLTYQNKRLHTCIVFITSFPSILDIYRRSGYGIYKGHSYIAFIGRGTVHYCKDNGTQTGGTVKFLSRCDNLELQAVS